MKADDNSDWRKIHLTPEQFVALMERLIEKYPVRKTTNFNQDLTRLDVIPLFHVLWDALAAEKYEVCAEVKKEIEYRKLHKTLCPFSVAVLKQSDYPLFGMLDDVNPKELLGLG